MERRQDMDNSHKTAIARTRPSVPMRWLHSAGLLVGRMLDYGCGRGFDAEAFGMDRFDPHYYPNRIQGEYDTITCNYVLNVVDDQDAERILSRIKRLLAIDGVAYVTIRRDIKTEGYTSRGTYQVNRRINYPVLRETASYAIYVVRNS